VGRSIVKTLSDWWLGGLAAPPAPPDPFGEWLAGGAPFSLRSAHQCRRHDRGDRPARRSLGPGQAGPHPPLERARARSGRQLRCRRAGQFRRRRPGRPRHRRLLTETIRTRPLSSQHPDPLYDLAKRQGREVAEPADDQRRAGRNHRERRGVGPQCAVRRRSSRLLRQDAGPRLHGRRGKSGLGSLPFRLLAEIALLLQ
jgi:hypothetical protein